MGNRSNINLVGNTTQGQNVGSGEGVYKAKSVGNIMQYKSLSVTGTTMAITCDADNIYFSAATGGGGGSGFTIANNGLCTDGVSTVGLGGGLSNNTIISGGSSWDWDMTLCKLNNFTVEAGAGAICLTGCDGNSINVGGGIILNGGGTSYIHMCNLQAKTSETNVLYIDSAGKISSGATGGGETYWSSGATGLSPAAGEDVLLPAGDNLKWADDSCITSSGGIAYFGNASHNICAASTSLRLCSPTIYLGQSAYYISINTGSKLMCLGAPSCWDLNLCGGNSSDATAAGQVRLIGGGGSSTGCGGDICLCGGIQSAAGKAGSIFLQGGDSSSGPGGDVYLRGGDGTGASDGTIYLDGTNPTGGYGKVVLGSPTTNAAVDNQQIITCGLASNIGITFSTKGTCGINLLTGRVALGNTSNAGFVFDCTNARFCLPKNVHICGAGGIASVSCCDGWNIDVRGGFGSSNIGYAGTGGTVCICGGCACLGSGGSGAKDGGSVVLHSGPGINGGVEGRIVMDNLPVKSSETCGIYIDASGNLSTGVISGGSGGGSGFTASNNGLCDDGTTVGLGGTLANDTTIYGDTYSNQFNLNSVASFNVTGGSSTICTDNVNLYGCGSTCVMIGPSDIVFNTNDFGNIIHCVQNVSNCHVFCKGNIRMCALPAKSTETDVLYINSAGQLSSGATGGGGSAISGYTCATNDSVSIGDGAFPYDADSLRDVAIGCGALKSNTSGDDNIGIGAAALCSNNSGYGNTAVGSCALCSTSNGFRNTAVGMEAQSGNLFGDYNVAIGYRAQYNNQNSNDNIGIGSNAVYCSGHRNIGIGTCAMRGTSANPIDNVAIGYHVMPQTFSGGGNVAIGSCAYCTINNTANSNTIIGACAGQFIEGSCNVIIGYRAGQDASVSGQSCLIIANAAGATGLIYGDFTTNCIYNGGDTSAWDTTSDCRIKECVETISDALSTVSNLNPICFDYTSDYTAIRNWNEEKRVGNHGFLAQEFETVFPKYVGCTQGDIASGNTVSDFRTINTGHLIPVLVKAIQELEARVQQLESQ